MHWAARYEELRASALSGACKDTDDARRIARYGLWGLASGRPAWRVVVSEAPEPRWTGGDPRVGVLASAYGLVFEST